MAEGTMAEGTDPRRALADRLSLLWVQAGEPTCDRVAREATNRLATVAVRHRDAGSRTTTVSKQRVSAWRSGRQVPRDFVALAAVVGALVAAAKQRTPTAVVDGLYDGCEWRRLWQQATDCAGPRGRDGRPSNVGGVDDAAEQICPYRGLAAYTSDHARYFFGRAGSTRCLVTRVNGLISAGGLFMLVAPSGQGKSSLLGAGLVPAIRAGQLSSGPTCDSADWPIVELTPGSDPLAVLANRIPELGEVVRDVGLLVERARELRAAVAAHAQLGAGPGAKVVLLVDQFEELFTLCSSELDRELFIEVLEAVSRGPDAPALVVVGMRADFYPHCSVYAPLREALQHRHMMLAPMSGAELTEAITGPAKAAGLRLDDGLVELLLHDAGSRGSAGDPSSLMGVLPLLSHALRATWEHRANGRLTVAGYRRSGGIDGAISLTAEQTLAQLDADARSAAMSMLLRLTRVGEDYTRDGCRRCATDRLLEQAAAPEATQRALEAFVRARLVSVDATTAQLTHEAVLVVWPQLRRELDRHRLVLLGLQRLEDDARAWREHDRDPSRLYRGEHLSEVQGWIRSDDDERPELDAGTREFLAEAVALQERENAELQRRLRGERIGRLSVAVLAMVGIVIAALAGLAIQLVVQPKQATSAVTVAAVSGPVCSIPPSQRPGAAGDLHG